MCPVQFCKMSESLSIFSTQTQFPVHKALLIIYPNRPAAMNEYTLSTLYFLNQISSQR